MLIEQMRSYIRSVVEIDSSDIDDDTLNRFLGEGYDQIVYSEKRWPWYEASTTFRRIRRDIQTDSTGNNLERLYTVAERSGW